MKQVITKLLVPFVFTSGLLAQNNATLYNISTVAGSAPSLSSTGAANLAFLQEADGIAVDPSGNIYFSDSVNGVIRKAAVGTGTVSTFLYLGTGIFGLATDAAGNVYAAVSGWHAVIKCGPNCNPNGIPASTSAPFSGGSYVFIAGTTNHSSGYSGDGGPATGRYVLNSPHGVALDAAGNVYIADTSNNRVRKVDTAGILHTIAGTGASVAPTLAPVGTSLFGLPYTCANAQVTVLNAVTGTNLTQGTSLGVNVAPTYLNVGDGCLGTQAILNGPWGVLVDPAGSGTIYIIDTGNNRVRALAPGTNIISTYAGNGIATQVTGAYTGGATNVGLGDGQAATAATLKTPEFGVIDSNGNFFVSDNGNTRVRRITNGVITSYSAGSATSNGLPGSTTAFVSPRGLAIDNSGNLLIADGVQIKSVDPIYLVPTPIIGRATNLNVGDSGPATSAVLNGIAGGVAIDTLGDVFIADTANNRIREVTPNGVINTIAGNGIAASYTAATQTAGFSTTSGDNGSALSSRVNSPGCVAVDGIGNIYFADKSDARIRKIQAGSGIITTIVGPSMGANLPLPPYPIAFLSTPQCVAVDQQGNVYFTEGNSVQKLNVVANTVTVIAGQPSYLGNTLNTPNAVNGSIPTPYLTGLGTVVAGIAGNSGDGTLGIYALLNAPVGIAVDNAGDVFIADKSNNEIREINGSSGIISTILGTIQNTGDYGNVPNPTTGIVSQLCPGSGCAYGLYVNAPQGVAVDNSGNVYVANTGSNRIDKIDTTGNLITIAGASIGAGTDPSGNPYLVQTGSANGTSTQPGAQILSPQAITVDNQGNVYFSDRLGLIRKLTPVNAH